jgi:signal transduction histidine kinase
MVFKQNDSGKNNNTAPSYRIPFVILLAGWSVAIALIALFHYHLSQQSALKLARTEARSSYERDLAYRHWAARAEGVFVPEGYMAPNPYLKADERTLIATTGEKLSRVNPAYMTRTVYEQAANDKGFYGRITSLKPLNPANAPDHWERSGLQRLHTGELEVSERITHQGQMQLRFMGPLRAEKACLRCHEGYKAGDLIGAISVSVPWAPYQAGLDEQCWLLAGGYGGLWLLGALGLRDMRRRILTGLKRERRTLKLLSDREQTLINQSRIAAMGEMTSAIAHHWRQPLTVISLLAQDARQAWYDREVDDAYIDHISEKIKELTSELSETITLLGGINTPREELLFKSAKEPIETVLKLLQAQFETLDIHIDFILQASGPQPEGGEWLYPSALRHSLINLLLNSRDAILTHRTQSEGEPKSGHITLTLKSELNQEQITLCDNGGGFSPEALKHGFEPFYSTKEQHHEGGSLSGTGLGLFITKAVVIDQMGGDIALFNRDKGACVAITLPRKRAF